MNNRQTIGRISSMTAFRQNIFIYKATLLCVLGLMISQHSTNGRLLHLIYFKAKLCSCLFKSTAEIVGNAAYCRHFLHSVANVFAHIAFKEKFKVLLYQCFQLGQIQMSVYELRSRSQESVRQWLAINPFNDFLIGEIFFTKV